MIGNVGVKYILVGLLDYSPVCLLIYVSLIVIYQRGKGGGGDFIEDIEELKFFSKYH